MCVTCLACVRRACACVRARLRACLRACVPACVRCVSARMRACVWGELPSSSQSMCLALPLPPPQRSSAYEFDLAHLLDAEAREVVAKFPSLKELEVIPNWGGAARSLSSGCSSPRRGSLRSLRRGSAWAVQCSHVPRPAHALTSGPRHPPPCTPRDPWEALDIYRPCAAAQISHWVAHL